MVTLESRDATRPDPDRLLAQIRNEARKAQRGKLKIFFGSVAGVGKTTAMLLAGQHKSAEGYDVVAGWVETHGRSGPQALLDGFEVLPPLTLPHRGHSFEEFNLDLALARCPQLIMVDELAHTNLQGARFQKRWQDIEALLDAGIDVYTTVNVQHIESLNDAVSQIVGVRIQETVPDRIFDQADEVSLIDLPAREILDRLREGKIYPEGEAKRALRHFFKEGNLIALREMALRETTRRVDAQMQVYRARHAISDPSPLLEQVLVCLGAGSDAENLVLEGKRFASALGAEWTVLYVVTPALERLSANEKDRVLKALRLASDLGAKTATPSASDISEEILRFARESGINQIMLGRSMRRARSQWLGMSVVDRVITGSQTTTIHLLRRFEPAKTGPSIADQVRNLNRTLKPGFTVAPKDIRVDLIPSCVFGATAALISASFALAFRTSLSDLTLGFIFLSAIIGVSLLRGQWVSTVVAGVLSITAFELLRIGPGLEDRFDGALIWASVFMVGLGGVTTSVVQGLHARLARACQRAHQSQILFNLIHDLSTSASREEALERAVSAIHRTWEGRAVILLPNTRGILEYPRGKPQVHSLIGADLGVAQWVFQHNERAGQGSNTLSAARAVYIPMMKGGRSGGVVAIDSSHPLLFVSPEERELMDTMSALLLEWLAQPTPTTP